MRKTFRYRLYPNKEQLSKIERTLEVCRQLYNDSLAERIEAYRIDGFSLTYQDQQNDLPEKKEANPDDYADVHSHVLQDVVRRLDKAYHSFFQRVKKGAKPGFPRFKAFGRYDSFTYPQSGFRPMPSGRVKMSGIGEVKANMHRPIEGTIKTCTVRRSAGKWYVAFSCDNVPEKRLAPNGESVGIDVGLKHFAVLSTGETVANPRFLKEKQRELAKAQRAVARRTKGSHRRSKAIQRLQTVYQRISDRRSDFHHKIAKSVVDRFGRIAVEKLKTSNMIKNHRLARSISDAGWAQFRSILHAKAEEAGREYREIDPKGTSQTCLCGAEVRKTLSERRHECPSCGSSTDRDHMSAMVILQRAFA